jgi:hypothetical protein
MISAEPNKNSVPVVLQADFEKGELDLLQAALKRNYTERFHMMTALMKMGLLMKKAKISHKSIAVGKSHK